jgi:hypothetical protein
LGYDVDFVVGRCSVDAVTCVVHARFVGHAWLVFRRDGVTYVYEPTVQDLSKAVRPFDMVRHLYVPELGVGPNRRKFGFCGYLLTTHENALRP